MIWRIEIRHKKGVFDGLAENVRKSIMDLGLVPVSRVEVSRVYNIEGALTAEDIQNVAKNIIKNSRLNMAMVGKCTEAEEQNLRKILSL